MKNMIYYFYNNLVLSNKQPYDSSWLIERDLITELFNSQIIKTIPSMREL